MNVQNAADSCRTAILENGAMEWYSQGNYNLSVGHILIMCDKIVSGEIEDEKAHRWLGWIQACMCAAEVCTLEQLKQINSES